MTELWSIWLAVLASLTGCFGPILLKKGSGRRISITGLLTNYYVIFGLLLYVVSSVIFIMALRGGELSVLYPIIALSCVWVSLLSVRFLGENMNYYRWTGNEFIILGVALIGIGSQ